jgi:hypothetical protein
MPAATAAKAAAAMPAIDFSVFFIPLGIMLIGGVGMVIMDNRLNLKAGAIFSYIFAFGVAWLIFTGTSVLMDIVGPPAQ